MYEKPINLKKEYPKRQANTNCIVHYDSVKDHKCVKLTSHRLSNIVSADNIRQNIEESERERQYKICTNLPSDLLEQHGYHRKCYQRFF